MKGFLGGILSGVLLGGAALVALSIFSPSPRVEQAETVAHDEQHQGDLEQSDAGDAVTTLVDLEEAVPSQAIVAESDTGDIPTGESNSTRDLAQAAATQGAQGSVPQVGVQAPDQPELQARKIAQGQPSVVVALAPQPEVPAPATLSEDMGEADVERTDVSANITGEEEPGLNELNVELPLAALPEATEAPSPQSDASESPDASTQEPDALTETELQVQDEKIEAEGRVNDVLDVTIPPVVQLKPEVDNIVKESSVVQPEDVQIPDTGRLPASSSAVKVNRPILTNDLAVSDDAPQGQTPKTALQRYAARIPLEQDQPMISIALLVPSSGLIPNVEDLAQATMPITMLLDPALAGAKDVMTRYREVGLEVGIYADIPQELQAVDLLVYFESALSTLPETTVIAPRRLQSSQSFNSELLAAAQLNGHGLILPVNGLNSILRTAQKQGVKAQTLYRDLSDESVSARALSRFLEQAAFRAQRESGVIVLGRATPQMIEALQIWGQTRRAQTVQVVPVSTVLNAK